MDDANANEWLEPSGLALWVPKRSGIQYICTIPPSLGPVTRLAIKSGRVVAETKSGIDMIVPSVPVTP